MLYSVIEGYMGVWCLMSHSTTFQLYNSRWLYTWREGGVPGENVNVSFIF